MPTGFKQQEPIRNFGFFKPQPKPQHGQGGDAKAVKPPEDRSFQPRPGH